MLSAGRRPTLQVQKVQKVQKIQKIPGSRMPLESEKSHFFKGPFMKMAALVVGGSESGWGLAGSPSELKNAWICFRTSTSSAGKNPSLQIRCFCENRRKCYMTCYPTDGLSTAVLMRQDLHVADSS
jgi:hypothetical protein